MSKTVSGATSQFLWDVAAPLPLLLRDGSMADVYGPSGLPVEQINGASALWIHHDQIGSTRLVTDAAGVMQATYTFDAFGSLKASTGTITNPLRFAGQYQDLESGLYYPRARYYDPTTGNFISRDPAVATTRQPYAYVNDNPLNMSDPSGEYSYSYAQKIGTVGQTGGADYTMQYLQNHLAQLFPFGTGDCRTVVLGAHCDLSPFGQSDPVTVSAQSCRSFAFTTTTDNPSIGSGATVTFTTYVSGGDVYLQEQTNAPNAPWYVELAVRLGFVHATWEQLAGNLQNALAPPPLESSGIATPVGTIGPGGAGAPWTPIAP